jgi:hypothetical protein
MPLQCSSSHSRVTMRLYTREYGRELRGTLTGGAVTRVFADDWLAVDDAALLTSRTPIISHFMGDGDGFIPHRVRLKTTATWGSLYADHAPHRTNHEVLCLICAVAHSQ